MIHFNKIGQIAREGFIIQCVKDPKPSKERITRHKT